MNEVFGAMNKENFVYIYIYIYISFLTCISFCAMNEVFGAMNKENFVCIYIYHFSHVYTEREREASK
jgi:hypothetical protein